MLSAAADRLGRLLAELSIGSAGSLLSCGAAGAVFCDRIRKMPQRAENRSATAGRCQPSVVPQFRSFSANSLLQWAERGHEAVSQAIAAIGDELGVDGDGLRTVIEQAHEAIALVGSIAPHLGLARLLGGVGLQSK